MIDVKNFVKNLVNKKVEPYTLNPTYYAPEGELGLNETSAAHLCAIASQLETSAKKYFENLSFVNTTMNIVGSNGKDLQTEVGETNLENIETNLANIRKYNAFIAWFAECRKDFENAKDDLKDYQFEYWIREHYPEDVKSPKIPKILTLEEFCKVNNILYPAVPVCPEHIPECTMTDVIDLLNIKDRNTYLTLEAKAAAYGKILHPDNPFEEARDFVHEVVSAPFMKEGNGRDTIVYHRNPSVPVENVDELYNKMQDEYRKIEQNLNHMKADLRKTLEHINLLIENENITIDSNYTTTRDEWKRDIDHIKFLYNDYVDKLNANHAEEYNAWITRHQAQVREFALWKEAEMAKLAKKKFAVPEALVDTMKYLNSLGK